jgi:hypothetical protein
VFKDTEDDWAVWFERLGTSVRESNEDLATPVGKNANCETIDLFNDG